MAATIHRLRVRNFQSLHDIELELLPFTVIVGPSSSGKSALTRALRTLVSNRRGTEWITHGERTASITAETDAGTVTLTRSRSSASSDNAYTLTPADNPEAQRTYAKLGGDTPEDVSRFLGINSGTTATPPINFAGQFDKPFLLADSTADVARTLGALTNVNIIFEGARESNRQKLANAVTLRTRAADLEAVKARVPEFRALKAQDVALTAAEQIIEHARQLERQIARLSQALDIVTVIEPSLPRLQRLADIVVPDETSILRAQSALSSFQQALTRIPTLARAQQAAQQAYDVIDTQEAKLLADYAEFTGEITDSLHGWIGGMTLRGDTRIEFSETGIEVEWIQTDVAVSLFLKYLETKASS
jgi:DNA repair ATPase RecN